MCARVSTLERDGGPVQLSLFSPQPSASSTEGSRHVPISHSSITRDTSLHAAFAAYSAHLDERDLADASRSAMRRDMDVAGRILGMNRAVNSLSRHDLDALVDSLHEAYSASTVARRVATVNGFIRWLADQGAADLPLIPTPHVDPLLPTVLDRGQARRLLEATKASRDVRSAFLVRLVLTTAMKKHEVMALRIEDVATDAEPAYVAVRGKGHKRRNVTVPAELRHFYEAYREQYGPVERLFPVTSRTLEYELEDLSEALDAPVTFTVLRWTAALRDLQAGMEPDRLRRKMGLSGSTWENTLERLRRVAV
jgi:site-specific recombinase XerD